MTGPIDVEVKVVREVDRQKLLSGPLRKFFQRMLFAMHRYAAEPGHVPIDTGYGRQTLAPGGGVSQVDSADPPTFAVLGSNVAYLGYLNNDPRYHYRGGPASGQTTEGWFNRTLDDDGANIGLGEALAALATDIESGWKAAA